MKATTCENAVPPSTVPFSGDTGALLSTQHPAVAERNKL